MKAERVLVVGAGQMGQGIAQVMAASGRDVMLVDERKEAPVEAKERILRILSKREKQGKAAKGEARAIVGRIQTPQRLCLDGVGLVIEAIVEERSAKERLFSMLGKRSDPETVLASNTSSIPINVLAAAAERGGETVGMHFMNPVPLMPLVEVVAGEETREEVVLWVEALSREIGKTPVRSADRPGFISNRILMPMINEAIRALEEGVGGVEAIDSVMELGMRHPMGPLKLADLIGLDTCLAILEVLHAEWGDGRHRPARLLRKMVEKGTLGRKTGEGFHTYDRHLWKK